MCIYMYIHRYNTYIYICLGMRGVRETMAFGHPLLTRYTFFEWG